MIALAHHWIVSPRGGEKVLAQFHLLFPRAPIATLVCRRGGLPGIELGSQFITSPLQKIPYAERFYKNFLPAHAWAFNRLAVPDSTRLVISSDASMVKGLHLPNRARQVCYCHSPARYLWDMQEVYAKNASNLGFIGRAVFRWTVPRARQFDYERAQRVDRFIANSTFVAERIKRFYNREAAVIYPPVEVESFDWKTPPENFYLYVGQLVPYKRVDIAVTAFNRLQLPLVIIGEGSELGFLKALAGSTIKFLGRQPFDVIKDYFQRCRAFLNPQLEDFGITAVEAQASGRPVIAYRAGGALESVVEGKTGVFFNEQTPESMIEAVRSFENEPSLIQPQACRQNAERFGPERFRLEIKTFLEKHYGDILRNHVWPDSPRTVQHVNTNMLLES